MHAKFRPGEMAVVDDDGSVTPLPRTAAGNFSQCWLNANRLMSYPTLVSALWATCKLRCRTPLQVVVRDRGAGSGSTATRAPRGRLPHAVDPWKPISVAQELAEGPSRSKTMSQQRRSSNGRSRCGGRRARGPPPFRSRAMPRAVRALARPIEAERRGIARGTSSEVLSNTTLVAVNRCASTCAQQSRRCIGPVAAEARAVKPSAMRVREGAGPCPRWSSSSGECSPDPTLLPTEAGFMTPLPA
jgi:hypothetical protein